MPGQTTSRKTLESSRPLLDAFQALSAHAAKANVAWRRALKQDACVEWASLLGALPLRFSKAGPMVNAADLERQGWEMARQGVPLHCVVAAVDRYLENSLPHLLPSPTPERVIAFADWVSSCRGALVRGHTRFTAEERQTLADRITKTERRTQDFAVQLGEAYEAERRRLAQDLHDEIGHDLIVLKLYTEVIALDLKKQDIRQVKRKLREAVKLIQHALKSVRRLTFDLGPEVWHEQGFVPAVRLYVRQFARRTGIKVRLNASALRAVLPARCETALYRVLQGALANVAAHANAQSVRVTLSSNSNQAILKIEDDGKGFNVGRKFGAPPESYGLRAMRERMELLGGNIQFESHPSRRPGAQCGTTVLAQLPLQGPDTE
jgi:signal transduction histidine kinase